MITYVPSYICATAFDQGVFDDRQPRDYLPLYEHLARKVLDWKLPLEVLVDTSAVNVWSFQDLYSQDDARKTLAKLFLAVGTGYSRGTFLRRMGLRRWRDLDKPIRVPGKRSTCRIEYDVCERRLRPPPPNDCHPRAVYGQSAAFRFGHWDRRWHFIIHYGYSHDGSTWEVAVVQGTESLSTFVNTTVPQWLDTRLEPEEWAGHRQQKNRDYDRLREAVDDVFVEDWYDPNAPSIEALVDALLDGHKPRLTRRRLTTVRGWMKESP